MDQTVSRKRWYLKWYMWIVYALVLVVVLSINSASKKAKLAAQNAASTTAGQVEPQPAPVATESAPVVDATSKAAAQKELEETMALAKKATLVTSYEFSESANVVYVGPIWYTQTAIQKKDFLAYVAKTNRD